MTQKRRSWLSFSIFVLSQGLTQVCADEDYLFPDPKPANIVHPLIVFENKGILYQAPMEEHVTEQAKEKNVREELAIRPDEDLTAGIPPKARTQRAAALRLAEKGRKLLQMREYERALLLFEKSLAMDSNPFFYYYLARVHHHLANYHQSSKFLEIAESWLSEQPDWMAKIAAVKGENLRALASARADANHIQPPKQNLTTITSKRMNQATGRVPNISIRTY